MPIELEKLTLGSFLGIFERDREIMQEEIEGNRNNPSDLLVSAKNCGISYKNGFDRASIAGVPLDETLEQIGCEVGL